MVERLFGAWDGAGATAAASAHDRRHGHVGRAPRPGHPSAGLGADRDPDRPSGRPAPDRRLPCRLGHERHPRRPVQLAPQHEAARGEGLHLRGGRRLRHAPGRRTVRGACRGQHGGHRAGHRGHARRADADPRGAGRGRRAGRRSRLPDRRLPAPVRDRRGGRRRARQPRRPRPGRRGAGRLSLEHRGGRHRGGDGRRPVAHRCRQRFDRAGRRRRCVRPRRSRRPAWAGSSSSATRSPARRVRSTDEHPARSTTTARPARRPVPRSPRFRSSRTSLPKRRHRGAIPEAETFSPSLVSVG